MMDEVVTVVRSEGRSEGRSERKERIFFAKENFAEQQFVGPTCIVVRCN